MSTGKKVLGLNFGRVNGNCKKFLNAAIESAKAAGAEVEIIDTMKLEIKPCIGCGGCSRILQSGKGQIRCVQRTIMRLCQMQFWQQTRLSLLLGLCSCADRPVKELC